MTTTTPQDGEMFDAIRREVNLARALGEPVSVTWWLIASNLVLFVVAFLYGFRMTDGFEFSAHAYQPVQMVFYTGMKVNSEIAAGEWWRLPSSMWVHLDLLHIAFNVYGLYVIGPILEKFYGARRFFVLYMVTGIVAAACSYVFNVVDSGGASGALYGLVGALGVFGIKHRSILPERVTRAFTVGMFPWVVLSIGIGFFDALPFDNAAHLGGLFSGGILAVVLGSRLRRRTRVLGGAALSVAAVIGAIVVLLTAWFWSAEASQCLAAADNYLQCYPHLTEHLVRR